MDTVLPLWIRVLIGGSAVLELFFGLTLIFDPAREPSLWPWVIPPLTTRVLGASALVSVSMTALAIGINRYRVAAIALVMMGTYRVFQLAAGLMALSRFGGNVPAAINYFGGGLLMMFAFFYCVYAGQTQRLRPAPTIGRWDKPMPWRLSRYGRFVVGAIGCAYMVLGACYFVAASDAAAFWIDANGLTPLTARLFSSPLIGLGLGVLLVSLSGDWRAVMIPAVGLITAGIGVMLAFGLGHSDFDVSSTLGGLVAFTPIILFVVGIVILVSKPHATTSTGS